MTEGIEATTMADVNRAMQPKPKRKHGGEDIRVRVDDNAKAIVMAHADAEGVDARDAASVLIARGAGSIWFSDGACRTVKRVAKERKITASEAAEWLVAFAIKRLDAIKTFQAKKRRGPKTRKAVRKIARKGRR